MMAMLLPGTTSYSPQQEVHTTASIRTSTLCKFLSCLLCVLMNLVFDTCC
jgi:hypothetical protein